MSRLRHIAVACGIVLTLAVPGTAVAQQATPAQQVFTDQQRAVVDHYKRSPSYRATLREARVAGAPQPAQVSSGGGLDWVDAGIGAAGMLALGLIALGGVVAVQHRRPAATR